MSELSLSTFALADLEEIEAWSLDRWGEGRTRAYLADLIGCFDAILATPGMGKPCPEFAEGARVISVAEHVVFYVPTPAGPRILRVQHQRSMPTRR